jgi:hypothetical protein
MGKSPAARCQTNAQAAVSHPTTSSAVPPGVASRCCSADGHRCPRCISMPTIGMRGGHYAIHWECGRISDRWLRGVLTVAPALYRSCQAQDVLRAVPPGCVAPRTCSPPAAARRGPRSPGQLKPAARRRHFEHLFPSCRLDAGSPNGLAVAHRLARRQSAGRSCATAESARATSPSEKARLAPHPRMHQNGDIVRS